MPSDDSSTNPRCGNGGCGHLRSSHFNRVFADAYCIGSGDGCPCTAFQLPVESGEEPCGTCGGMLAGWCRHCGRRVPDGEEPACLHLLTDHEGECPCPPRCGCCMVEAPPPPPQPLRRPPYAVAYSVAGHLYEIALPGDATVHATDGGLIITHSFAPVAGVVRVHPIEGEQS